MFQDTRDSDKMNTRSDGKGHSQQPGRGAGQIATCAHAWCLLPTAMKQQGSLPWPLRWAPRLVGISKRVTACLGAFTNYWQSLKYEMSWYLSRDKLLAKLFLFTHRFWELQDANNLKNELVSNLFVCHHGGQWFIFEHGSKKWRQSSCLRGLGIFGKEDTLPFLKICLNEIHQVLWRKNIGTTCH